MQFMNISLTLKILNSMQFMNISLTLFNQNLIN